MASHAFITTWLLAPGGGTFGVDWNAGLEVWSQKGVFKELSRVYGEGGDFKILGCSDHSVAWAECGEEKLGGHGSQYSGPDVYIWWENRSSKQKMGGFLDHWTLDRPRRRDFNNIREGWKMEPKRIYAQAGRVRIGLQGDLDCKLSEWFNLH